MLPLLQLVYQPPSLLVVSATEVIAIAALFPILVTSKEATVEKNTTNHKTSLVLATEQELDMALVPDMPKDSLASLANQDSVSAVSAATAQDMAVMATAPPEFTVDMVVMVDMVATEAMAAMVAAASVI